MGTAWLGSDGRALALWMPAAPDRGPRCGSGGQLSLPGVGGLRGRLAWLERGQTTVKSVSVRHTESSVATEEERLPQMWRGSPLRKGSTAQRRGGGPSWPRG